MKRLLQIFIQRLVALNMTEKKIEMTKIFLDSKVN